MPSITHLAGRFFGSLRARPLNEAEAQRVTEWLSPAEMVLWRRMSKADQRHAFGVANTVSDVLGTAITTPIVRAALLHDVGKVAADLGTYGRVIATLSAKVAGYEMASVWVSKRGFTRKVGLYLEHDRVGADMLAMAGSDELVVAWAREHHWAEDRWSVPHEIGRVLRAADGD